MLHHILVKWNETVADKPAMAERAEEAFRGARAIPGISGCEVIRSNSDRANRYDLMIEMDMDIKALPAYDASETHRSWKRDYAAYIETKAIFDCED